MKKSIHLLIVIFAVLLSIQAQAQEPQTVHITGKIYAAHQAAVAASVNLLRAKDSSLVKSTLTSDSGTYNIKTTAGSYILQVQLIGFKNYYSAIFNINGNQMMSIPDINLEEIAKNLETVVVSTQKPFIQRTIDKIVVNVASSPTTAGNTTWDMMSKLPGVMVDQSNNNINLTGKNGVVVYIDGKPTYLSSDQLAARLKSMDASTIETIEIMTNPSAKYDAAGNAGIINIVTKKNKTIGFNGSVNAGFGIGVYNRENVGTALNYRNGKVNIYGNYTFSKVKNWHDNHLERRFGDSIYSPQNAHNINRFHSHDFKVGIDYYTSAKDILGVSVQGNINPSTENGNNTTDFLRYDIPTLKVNTLNQDIQRNTNMTYNLNYEHKFNKDGHSISADIVYSKYNAGQNEQNFTITNYNPDGSLVSGGTLPNPNDRKGLLPSYIDIKTGKIDYARPLKNNAKIELGAKSSYVTSDNDIHYYNLINQEWVIDPTTTNHFKYTENINALYANYSQSLTKGWSVQLGLRGEQTVSKGHQFINDSTVNRNYFQLFPTAFLQKQFKDIHTLGLSYSRRIDRPDYQDLNPFQSFLDPYTFSVGNPFLRPQVSNNLELSYSYKSLIVASLAYAYTADMMTDILKQVDSSKITYQTKDNMGHTTNWTATVALNWPVNKWFTSNTSVFAIRNTVSGLYMNAPMYLTGNTLGFNTSNIFTIAQKYKMEISGNYHSPILWGMFDVRHQLQINWGIQKSILEDKGTVKIGVNDILRSNQNNVYIRYGNINAFVRNSWDSRRLTLSFTYRFNSGAKLQGRQRQSAISDEQNRIKK